MNVIMRIRGTFSGGAKYQARVRVQGVQREKTREHLCATYNTATVNGITASRKEQTRNRSHKKSSCVRSAKTVREKRGQLEEKQQESVILPASFRLSKHLSAGTSRSVRRRVHAQMKPSQP